MTDINRRLENLENSIPRPPSNDDDKILSITIDENEDGEIEGKREWKTRAELEQDALDDPDMITITVHPDPCHVNQFPRETIKGRRLG